MLGYGLQTNLIFNSVYGIIEENEKYLIIITPDNPDYYFGNYLLLKNVPNNESFEHLEKDFRELIGILPGINHLSFMWKVDGLKTNNVDRFVTNGYEFNEFISLVAEENDLLRPHKLNESIEIIELTTEKHWQEWYDIEFAERDLTQPIEAYEGYLNGMMRMYRKLIAVGKGSWYGAFVDGELVAHLGLFYDNRIGRFQSVVTKPAYRNQGICSTLVYQVALEGFTLADKLVMVADENYHAAKIYESLGFKPKEKHASLCWWQYN